MYRYALPKPLACVAERALHCPNRTNRWQRLNQSRKRSSPYQSMLARFAPDRRATGAQACRDTTDRRTRETTARPPAPHSQRKEGTTSPATTLDEKRRNKRSSVTYCGFMGQSYTFHPAFPLDTHFFYNAVEIANLRKRRVSTLAPLAHHSFSLFTHFPFTTVQTQQSPESLSSLEACCKMAATYSPAGVQYHRRGRA